MAIVNSPPTSAVDSQDSKGKLLPPAEGWRNYFVAVFNVTNAMTLSGVTAERPTVLLWEGRPFTDTTLGRPIWYIGGIWVFSDGTPA